MKLVVAGSRDLEISIQLFYHIFQHFNLNAPVIISGGASGIDTKAIEFATMSNREFKLFNPDWETHGKAAGPIRNSEMAKEGDALLLIWDGQSRGSADMKRKMKKLGKPIYEFVIRGEK